MLNARFASTDGEKRASLYRMVMSDHVCPYGLKALDLLERKGYEVDDHHLQTREQTDQFKAEHGVKTTPQVFIEGHRVGGYDATREFFGADVPDEDATSYKPVFAIFGMCAWMAVALSYAANGELLEWRTIQWFFALSMAALAIQKLQDVEQFSTMFLNYDLLARRWVRYGYVYPFAEAGAAVLMLAGVLPWLSGPVALFIGTIGAISVAKAVYIDKRELKCACVGGGSNVPLGFVSLTENVVMMGMGVWVLAATILG